MLEPTLIKKLQNIKIKRITCGTYHTVFLSEGGQAFITGYYINNESAHNLSAKTPTKITLREYLKKTIDDTVTIDAIGSSAMYCFLLLNNHSIIRIACFNKDKITGCEYAPETIKLPKTASWGTKKITKKYSDIIIHTE